MVASKVSFTKQFRSTNHPMAIIVEVAVNGIFVVYLKKRERICTRERLHANMSSRDINDSIAAAL